MASLWTRAFSKTYSRDYWFNTSTGAKSWTEPVDSKDQMQPAAKPVDEKTSEIPQKSLDGVVASEEGSKTNKRGREDDETQKSTSKRAANTPRIAIIVPFQDAHVEQRRKAHLDEFLPEMESFLQRSGLDFKIFIAEQEIDDRKFNRGALLNVGFELACKEDYNVFVFHDVDLVPSKELLPFYATVPAMPVHIARVWGRYSSNAKYFGGVVSFSEKDFRAINGFPNEFWGWGGEDDALIKRVEEMGLEITYPTQGSIRDMEEMDLSEKLSFLKEHKEWKCGDKWERLKEDAASWRSNGLSSLQFEVQKTCDLAAFARKYTIRL